MVENLARYFALELLLILILGGSHPASSQPVSWTGWSAPTSQGQNFQSSTLDGKVVVVSIWASWCSSSRRQMPLLSQLQRRHGVSELQVLTFSFDRSEAKHLDFLKAQGITFPAIYARNGRGLTAVRQIQARAGALEALPTLLVFDQEGRLVHRSVGFSDLSKLENLVTPLLDQPSASVR